MPLEHAGRLVEDVDVRRPGRPSPLEERVRLLATRVLVLGHYADDVIVRVLACNADRA
jgi:hypothetical protein